MVRPGCRAGWAFFSLILLAGYMYLTYLWAKQGNAQALLAESSGEEEEEETLPVGLCWVMLLGGLAMVVLAARILVPAAAEIALRIGVPEDVIAATMVALGTSLPELTTAIVSVRKGHPEITLGNVVGADVLNCLFVIGAAAASRSLAIPANFFYFHFPAMLIILYCLRGFHRHQSQTHLPTLAGGGTAGHLLIYVISQYTLAANGPSVIPAG